MTGRSEVQEDFVLFVQEHLDLLVRIARSLTGSADAADDLAQIALEKAYRSWGSVMKMAEPLAYVRRVLVNSGYDAWRRKQRFRRRFGGRADVVDPPAQASWGRSVETIDGLSVIDDLMRPLTDKERAVVTLRHLVGLTVAETAYELGIAEGTVKSTSARALSRMRVADPEAIGARHGYEDLRRLFNSPSGTRLTPGQIVQRHKAARRRAGVVTAAVAVTLAASASAIYLHGGSFNPNPPILATPSPLGSPTPSGTPSQEPTSPAATSITEPVMWEPWDVSRPACRRGFPDSWTKALNAAPNGAPAMESGIVLKSGATIDSTPGRSPASLTWYPAPGVRREKIVLVEDVDADRVYYETDGRYVVYRSSNDVLKLWDSENPDAQARTIDTGDIDSKKISRWALSEGQLWLLQPENEEPFPPGKLYHVDVLSDDEPKLVAEFDDVELAGAFGGRAQVRVYSHAVFVSPDGTQQRAPEAWGAFAAVDESSGMTLLGMSEVFEHWVYHPSWSGLVEIPPSSGAEFRVPGISGEWIEQLSIEPSEQRSSEPRGIVSLRTGVALEPTPDSGYEYRIKGTGDGNRYLVRIRPEGTGKEVKAVRFADLPDVSNLTCE